jgi:MFS family permease
MARNRFNRGVFLLESLNSLGTTFYFNYLFFFLKSQYGFTNRENLLVGALSGLIYVPCALLGGKIGQRCGYLFALKCGLSLMTLALVAGSCLSTVPALLIATSFWTVGMCFTWPNLEALACDRQPPERLPGAIGVYNVVWSGSSAIANFTGGAVAEHLGWRSIFWLPAIIHAVQIVIALRLRSNWSAIWTAPIVRPHEVDEGHPRGPLFLKLAWVANPFAYIAINGAIPLIPDVANRFHLSPAFAGFFCSIWFFARTLTFFILSLWSGWHYRFRYMALAYLGMIGAFAGTLLLNNLLWVIVVQILFGWCVGLIYYSSLYYSMHVGETKGEHGGFHEAAIGLGIFGGPAIGAASLYVAPGFRQSNVIGVVLVICFGFAALLFLRQRGKMLELPRAAMEPVSVSEKT